MNAEQINKLDKCRTTIKDLSIVNSEIINLLKKIQHGSNSDYGKELTSLTEKLKLQINSSIVDYRAEIDNLIKNI